MTDSLQPGASSSLTRCKMTAVVMLNLGGPDSPAAIEPFLANLFSDPDTIPLPWCLAPFQGGLARFVARKRAPKVAKLYDRIGGRSPILPNTRAQADALAAELASRGHPMPVHIAMRAWHPLTEEVIDSLVREGATEAILLPLYPQYSGATSGSSLKHFHAVSVARKLGLTLKDVPPYFDHPLYVEALVDTIRSGLSRFSAPNDVHIVFSAHSLPLVMVDKGDPYPGQIAATRSLVEASLGHTGPLHLAYQSQTGAVPWLGPTVHEIFSRIPSGAAVLMVPLGFVSDHLETLYEMDILYADLAEARGFDFQRAPSLGTHPTFIRALADMTLSV